MIRLTYLKSLIVDGYLILAALSLT